MKKIFYFIRLIFGAIAVNTSCALKSLSALVAEQ